MTESNPTPIVVLISANSEWRAALAFFHNPTEGETPFGSCFKIELQGQNVIFVQGGWGKISAAASTQYALQTFHPRLVINLGTCGGIEGKVSVGETVLVVETLVYDIFERMGDAKQALERYATRLDLSFLRDPYPQQVRRGRMLSADQDLDSALVQTLVEKYAAVAADWESGGIAWTAMRNQTPCLILRGVTDLVSSTGGEAYNNIGLFHTRTETVMNRLLVALPGWIQCSRDAGVVKTKGLITF
jgi:adenosylhomocysteine nucleosidase